MNARHILTGFAGMLLAAGVTANAEAQLVNAIHMTGSSASRTLVTEVPLNLCQASPTPEHYVNSATTLGADGNNYAANNLHVWRCTIGGIPRVIRYTATGSSDGITKLTVSEAASSAVFLDGTAGAGGCPASGTPTVSKGRTYNNFTGCTANFLGNVNVGVSDVFGSSFHQSSNGVDVNPLNQGSLLSTQVAAVPFSIVLGGGVYEMNDAGTQVTGPVNTLSRMQVEALLSQTVYTWKQLGLGKAPINSPPGTAVEADSFVTICGRRAGSGTKATLDETVMINAPETTTGTFDLTDPTQGQAYFGTSNNDVRDCIIGDGASRPAHPGAIGYMETDAAETIAAANPGKIYAVKLDGEPAWINGSTLVPPAAAGSADVRMRANIICGKYPYWAGLHMNTRNPASADAGTVTLITNFINNSKSGTAIANLPAGDYWTALDDMNVFKNADAGPLGYVDPAVYGACNSD